MKRIMIMAVVMLVAACGEKGGNTAMMSGGDASQQMDFAQVSKGARLYQKNCAECHGASGQGNANWRQRDADGMFPPPPLNGTGHTWHHPKEVLYDVITNGSPKGMGKMPAWRDKLSDEEIEAVIAWFQSRWPDQIYSAWYRMDRKARGG
jgi:mono/diheme cytochrome c family protein